MKRELEQLQTTEYPVPSIALVMGLVLLLAIFVTVFVGKKTDMLHAPLKCTLLGWCIFACFSYTASRSIGLF
mgnify:CR=1 FL=1